MRGETDTAGAHSGTTRPLRIALLGYRSNPYSGGQGIYLKYLSKALADLGHQVDVISGQPYPELHPAVRLIELPGLNLFEAENHVTELRPRHLRSITDTFEWWSMLTGGFPEPFTFGRRVSALLRRRGFDYDVIHDNQSLSNGILELQRRGSDVVTTIHHPITWDRDIALKHADGLGERLLIRRWHNFLSMQTRVARRLKHIVTVSHTAKRDICHAFGLADHRVTVVHNGIDTEAFAPNPPDNSRSRVPNLIVSTASADQPLKGTQHLIPAVARLKRDFPDLKLVMIGRPKPGGRTERLVIRHQLGASIEFRHGLTTKEIRDLYAQAAVAVVPSEYEGFGLPAGEAMACGIPVVSTDGGALPEIVGDAALVVPAGDPCALADGIAQLLRSTSLRQSLGQAGRRRILERFSWSRAARGVTDLYRKVIVA